MTPASAPIEGLCDVRFGAVRDAFAESFARGEEVGAAVSVVVDGRSVVDLCAGHADQARTRPWTRSTLVNVYSTTKGMAALCLLQLVEQGKVDLDAPVARYWPGFEAAGKGEIPVRWLLSHRAGLPAVRALLPNDALYDWDAMASALAAERPGGRRASATATTPSPSAGWSARSCGGDRKKCRNVLPRSDRRAARRRLPHRAAPSPSTGASPR